MCVCVRVCVCDVWLSVCHGGCCVCLLCVSDGEAIRLICVLCCVVLLLCTVCDCGSCAHTHTHTHIHTVPHCLFGFLLSRPTGWSVGWRPHNWSKRDCGAYPPCVCCLAPADCPTPSTSCMHTLPPCVWCCVVVCRFPFALCVCLFYFVVCFLPVTPTPSYNRLFMAGGMCMWDVGCSLTLFLPSQSRLCSFATPHRCPDAHQPVPVCFVGVSIHHAVPRQRYWCWCWWPRCYWHAKWHLPRGFPHPSSKPTRCHWWRVWVVV